MTKFILILMSGILINNYVLQQFLGICPFLGVSKKFNQASGMGIAVTFVMLCATAVTHPIYHYILKPNSLEYFETIVFILVIAALVQFVEIAMKKMIPSLHKSLGVYLPLITTNCAVLGSALINVQKNYGFIESVTFGFSAAVGFTIAILIFAGVRARLRFAEPPKAFRGIPILLLSAGLIAMAFSGFSGISL